MLTKGDGLYILDANIFIEAKNRYYGFDIAPGFWTALEGVAGRGIVITIDKVRDELYTRTDILEQWFRTLPDSCVAATETAAVVTAYQKVMSEATNAEQYSETALAKFADDADGWLIAYALATGAVIVTHEAYQPQAKNRVYIPNISRPLGIEDIDTFEYLRRESVALVLESAAL